MTKEWVEEQRKKFMEEASALEADIIAKIKGTNLLTDGDKEILLSKMEEEKRERFYMFDHVWVYLKDSILTDHDSIEKIIDFTSGLGVNKLVGLLSKSDNFDRYIDSEPMQFDGDIIITDPCYITKDGTDDWSLCGYGDNMERLGIQHSMVRDTIYGDWSCTVFDSKTKEPIGRFCADAGMVAVFLLDEVLDYNPAFNYHTERTWTTALIKDFSGTVQFVVKHEEGVYDDDTEWHHAGDKWEDYSVQVVGHGVNKKTGEPIDFISAQTGL